MVKNSPLFVLKLNLGPVYQYIANQGYLVFAFDMMGFGIRLLEGSKFYKRFPNWSILGNAVRDISGAIDFLTQVREKSQFTLSHTI